VRVHLTHVSAASLHTARADAHLELGAHDDAVKDLERVIRMQRGLVAETYVLLAETHRKRGDLASAAAAYGRAISCRWGVYGELCRRMEESRDLDRKDAQAEDLEILLLINPADTERLAERARMRAEAGAYAEALADLDRALDGGAAAYRSDLFHQRAAAWSGLGDHAKAAEDASRAIAIAPYEAEYHAWRAIYRALADGPSEEAEADVDRAVELAPDDLTVRFLRAWYFEIDDRPDAVGDVMDHAGGVRCHARQESKLRRGP
jgi:tetratricopeptide (TPR) repeat protein